MIEGHSTQYIGDGYTIQFDSLGYANLYCVGKRLARFGPATIRALQNLEAPKLITEHDARPYGGD